MKLLILAALAVTLFAQQPQVEAEDDPRIPHYKVLASVTASAGTAVTIQGNGRQTAVYMERAEVYCSAAGTVITIIDATAASTTAGTVIGPLFSGSQGLAGVVKPSVFTASNYVGGTTTGSWNCAAGETLRIRMTPLAIAAGATSASNITIAVTPATGTADFKISGQWRTALFNAAP